MLFSQKHLAENDEKKHTSIVFSLKEEVGSLARALKLFEVLHSFTCRILLGGALGVIFWRVGDLTIRLKSNPLLFSFCKYNFQSAFSDEISETKVLLERAQVTRKVNAVFFFFI